VFLWQKIVALCLGGALGAVTRVGLTTVIDRQVAERWPHALRFPWGTAVVNLSGCFLFGLVWASLESHAGKTAVLRAFLLAGFMGAFTTFSTFVFDIVRLSHTRWSMALANVLLQNVMGSLLLVLGLFLGRAR
jgi:fluoride exporter